LIAAARDWEDNDANGYDTRTSELSRIVEANRKRIERVWNEHFA